jgi:hypothetical protein
MFKPKHILANVILAAAALGACAQAAATPLYYHVDVDTKSLGTGPAWLDLYFMALDGAPAATAVVTHLNGALNGAPDLLGSVSGTGPYLFTNANGGGELVQAIQLGGKFGFDVSFTMAPGSTGTTFGWSLFDSTHYLGVNGDLGNLFLQPNAPAAQQILLATPPAALGGVTPVTEPPTPALMLAAVLGLLGWGGKRARRS